MTNQGLYRTQFGVRLWTNCHVFITIDIYYYNLNLEVVNEKTCVYLRHC